METIWIERHLLDTEESPKPYEQHWLVDQDGMLLARIRAPRDDAKEGSWCGELEHDKNADRYFIDLKAAKRWCEKNVTELSRKRQMVSRKRKVTA